MSDKVAIGGWKVSLGKKKHVLVKVMAKASDMYAELMERWPRGTEFHIEHDGFHGRVIGWYITHEGKPGIVGQLDDARIVHVYGEKWLTLEEAK